MYVKIGGWYTTALSTWSLSIFEISGQDGWSWVMIFSGMILSRQSQNILDDICSSMFQPVEQLILGKASQCQSQDIRDLLQAFQKLLPNHSTNLKNARIVHVSALKNNVAWQRMQVYLKEISNQGMWYRSHIFCWTVSRIITSRAHLTTFHALCFFWG